MTIAHCIAMVAPFVLICAGGATGQTKDVITVGDGSPKTGNARLSKITDR
jgi:hypothetical protein